MEGALLSGVPPRARLGQRDVRGKAGRSRPHLSWGFRVVEVGEIVVGKEVVKGMARGKQTANRGGRCGGWGLLFHPPTPPAVEALCFCFIVLKILDVVRMKLLMR